MRHVSVIPRLDRTAVRGKFLPSCWCQRHVWPRSQEGGDGTASADAVNPSLGASAATSLSLTPAESVPSPPPSRVQCHVRTTRLATEWLSDSAGGRIVVGTWQRTCWGGGQGKGRRNLRGRTPRRATRMMRWTPLAEAASSAPNLMCKTFKYRQEVSSDERYPSRS